MAHRQTRDTGEGRRLGFARGVRNKCRLTMPGPINILRNHLMGVRALVENKYVTAEGLPTRQEGCFQQGFPFAGQIGQDTLDTAGRPG